MITPTSTIAASQNGTRDDATLRQRLTVALDTVVLAGPVGESPPTEALVKPIQQINTSMQAYGVQFELHDQGKRIVTRIIERDSGELIRQIPNEAVLRIAEQLDSVTGLILEVQA